MYDRNYIEGLMEHNYIGTYNDQSRVLFIICKSLDYVQIIKEHDVA